MVQAVVQAVEQVAEHAVKHETKTASHAVILAGGSGTRLWPLSRALFPKQLMTLRGDYSLLQETLRRVRTCFDMDEVHIVTNDEHALEVREQCMAVEKGLENCVITEPCARNTLPAVLLGLHAAWEYERAKKQDRTGERVYESDLQRAKKSDISGDMVGNSVYDTAPNMAVFPSDHMVHDVERWKSAMAYAKTLAQAGHFVTFGVPPQTVETGYGYILRGECLPREAITSASLASAKPNSHQTKAFMVERFVEKPDQATATDYVQDGRYLWNSGMFALNGEALLKNIAAQQKKLWAWWEERHKTALATKYHAIPSVSVDYGIMEKAHEFSQVSVIEADFAWDDLGSFEALHRLEDKDDSGCVLRGDTIALDCKDSLLLSHGGKLVGIGLNNMVAVQTRDATLLCSRDATQKVKDVVDRLKAEKSPLAEVHLTVHRPWGSYTVLEEQDAFKIKRITVKPSACLSEQMHHHRSEHWVVVKGVALVQINDEEMLCTENQWAVIPCGARHRLSNPGKISLELIEIQRGSYLEEDDIVRFDDVYGR